MSTRRSARPQAIPATAVILIENRQRQRPIDRAELRHWVEQVLAEQGQGAELAIHLVGAKRSADLNEHYLNHAGPTDVITFDQGSDRAVLRGEIFICVSEAIRQAKEFHTTWHAELQRYVVHGLLHLRGFDDLEPSVRRKMKREEARVLRLLNPMRRRVSRHG